MKFAISNIAWQFREDESIYALMHKYGFKYLEIAPGKFFNSPYNTPKNHIEEKKKELKGKDIQVVSMQALLFGSHGLTIFDSEESRNALLNYMKKAIIFAEHIGAENLVFGSPNNRVIPEGMGQKEAEKIAVIFFKTLGDYAKQHNTIFSIEANPQEYGGNFINHTMEAVELIKKVDSDGFRLNLDLSTMTMNKEKYVETLKNALIFTNHIHISEPFLEAVPKANTNHFLFAELLKKSKYDGCVSIEMKSISDIDNYDHIENSMKFIVKTYGEKI